MVYLLKMVIFHGELLNNQRVDVNDVNVFRSQLPKCPKFKAASFSSMMRRFLPCITGLDPCKEVWGYILAINPKQQTGKKCTSWYKLQTQTGLRMRTVNIYIKKRWNTKWFFFTSQRLMGHLSIVDGAPWLSPSFLDLDLLELHELLFELLIDRVREVFFKGSSSRRWVLTVIKTSGGNKWQDWLSWWVSKTAHNGNKHSER
jgi:hypothetical protein